MSTFASNNYFFPDQYCGGYLDGGGMGLATALGTDINVYFCCGTSGIYRVGDSINYVPPDYVTSDVTMTISEVPEPSGLAVMAAGFGVLALAGTARGRRAPALRPAV